ncbi:heterodisulfide reductase-related iron-sulfur binding cluster [Deinococcus maricopensis]|uniref:4Fe-4S ferredoxin-type domain-containing protein n=1 Tax=Deinococcus maricopensis (strain DSM 21211 / LMG 22137 / NRRL B-23946 / LB-34) TaxID=709986 RepID=E8U9A0_DEIML|nr:heterodisulfide reductase-related iron-sulfur binding cluster [Deinococcus maricopensis]ADV67639.1 protein of unknown function DUF224 cysteine-rich region domain protein [Deinococcus maricopensis DSM 21211]
MLPLSSKILFFLFALITGAIGLWGFYRLYLRIRRGASATETRLNDLPARLWYALRTTLTQERTFRKRTFISVLHSFIFYGFIYYLLVNVIDGLEGYLHFSITSRTPIGAAYNLLADLLSFGVLLGVIGLVIRRFGTPAKRDFRFNEKTLLHESVKNRFITRDSAIVSSFITFHVGSRIIGQAAKLAQEGTDAWQPLTSAVANALFNGATEQTLMAWRVAGYWGALGSILAFLAYFPYTKHIHIFMAPVNYFLRRPVHSGVLPPMPGLEAAMESEEPKLGAQHLEDLEWPRLLDAYACIQCNRCQDVCPGSATGKALSPAALEINKRMELNVIGAHPSPFRLTQTAAFEGGASTARPLLEFAISDEAVWACTTCGACMQVCPVQDEQMLDIIDIRRRQVMVEGEFPAQLQTAFRGMERAANPWGISRDKRLEWAEGLKVPTIDENPTPDVIYWVGCAASYDPGAQKVARSFVQLLDKAGVNYAVLGKKEACTGDSARRAGNEFLYQQLATENIETLNRVEPKLIVATCPHCMNAIGNEYKQLGGDYQVMHHTQYLDLLVSGGQLDTAPLDASITYHDPCYLGRHNGVYDAPRSVIRSMGLEILELERTREASFCCGAGGAQFWKEEEEGRERISDNRFREIQARLDAAKEGKVLAVGCPFCKSMMNSTPSKAEADDIVVKDIAELMLESVQRKSGDWVEAPIAQNAPAPAGPADTIAAETPYVPNAALSVAQDTPDRNTHDSPDIVGETRADAEHQQPGSPAIPQGADLTAGQDSPAPAADAAPARKKWGKAAPSGDDVNPAPVPNADQPAPATEAAPARKKWGAKASADDVQPTPAPAPEASADATPTRKKWGGKASTDDVQTTTPAPTPTPDAPTPQAASTESAPARKKWGGKASSDDVQTTSITETTSAAPTSAPAEEGARKKWAPKAAPTTSATPTPEPTAAPAPASPADAPAETARPKWAPKAKAPEQAALAPAEPDATPDAAPEAPTTGERPKWQPKKKTE